MSQLTQPGCRDPPAVLSWARAPQHHDLHPNTAPSTPHVHENQDLPWQQQPDPAIISPSWGLQGSPWGPAPPNPTRTAKGGVYRPVFPAYVFQCPGENKLTPNSITALSTLKNISGCKLLFLILISNQGFT